MSVKLYAVCWDEAYDNCLDLHEQLKASEIPHLIYNVSTHEVDSDNWQRAEDLRYYGHFYNSLKDFKASGSELFVFNAGDAKYTSHSEYIDNIYSLFLSDPDLYLFAPSLTNDEFTGPGGHLADSKKYKDYYLATHTNGIYVFLRKELAYYILDFLDWATFNDEINLRDMTSGWGLDTAYASITIYWNKKIYRDKLVMEHPPGSTYEHTNAFNEMFWTLEKFRKYSELQEVDGEKLQKIYDIIYQKARQHNKIRISDIYLNIEELLEF